MDSNSTTYIPKSDEAIAEFQEETAVALESGIRRTGEMLAWAFGEEPAQAAMRGLLVALSFPAARRAEILVHCDLVGWREFLSTESGRSLDFVDLAQVWRDAAEYAGQGIAPREPVAGVASRADREARIKPLIEYGRRGYEYGGSLVGDDHAFIWTAAAARAALDFGGTVTAEGLRLLSGISVGAIRNAVSVGDLHPDERGDFAAEEVRSWLARRRDFCPSRWTNLADNQWPFDPSKVAEPDKTGMVWVPRGADGLTFTPEHVVRPARGIAALSVTVGAKGEERQYHDFYDALTALAATKVARWRRRNDVGNWGIVRARGAWVAVSKTDIDRQLADKLADVT